MTAFAVMVCASAVCAQTPEHVESCSVFSDNSPPVQQEADQSQLAQPRTVTIDAVDFDGPTALPDADLAQFVYGLEARRFVSTSDWLDEVTSRWVRAAWQEDGYFKVSATATYTIVGEDSANQHVALHIHVDPGLQYFMGDLRFRPADPRCPLVFPTDQLRSLVAIKQGDLFTASKINQSGRALWDLYRSHGYVDFSSELLFDVDDATQQINLTIQLNPRMQFRIGMLEVNGLDPLTADTWKSLFTPGDVFDDSSPDRLFQEYKTILPRNIRFREIDIYPHDDSGTVDIEFGFDRGA